MVGRTLGKYRIVEKIGRGGMGVVYLGVDETLDRKVAIKAISPELVEDDLVRRFRAEAVTLARVNHPNIASVYELFRDDDRLLMVMELVSGQTFEQLIDRVGPMPVERAASLTGQILDALAHAHAAGIVHRDLKPANLMLTDAGVVKVMDFGIARVSGTERMTSDGLMVGTPAYMAPEQVRGDEVDGRTDLYAVGVVFYRLLTGKLPFKSATAVAMIQSQLNESPTPARQVRAELPDWLDAVLMRALAKRPADRYQNADEFRRALDSLNQLGALAPLPDDITIATPAPAPVPSYASTAVTQAAALTPTSPHATTLVLNRSHLAVAGGFGAMLLLVIGLLAWVALRRPAPPVQVVAIPAVAPVAPAAPAAAAPAADAPKAPASPAAVPPAAAAAPAAVAPGAAAPPAAVVPAPPVVTPPAKVAPQVTTAVPAPQPGEPPLPPRGGRGRAAGAPAAGARGARGDIASPDVDFKPVVIRDVNALVVLPRGNRFVDAILAFSEKSITASDSHNGVLVKTFPYSAVLHTTVSRARKPKGAGGVDLQVDGGIPGGNIFARGKRLWLTLETADDRLVMRVEAAQLGPVADLLGQRTKPPIERFLDSDK